MNVLVTGAAGFIGFHLCTRLLARGDTVTGLDNLNDYYDVSLKQARLARLSGKAGFRFERGDVADRTAMPKLFVEGKFDTVAHLAAQAGVRYSIDHPQAYVDSNLVGFGNVLEGCRHGRVKHLVYASSSSVYGTNHKIPFCEDDPVDHPMSLYAATKRANELMAHTYSHLFALPATGLRFFTVYGPWGRPDMALFKFTRWILAGEPVPVFNNGDMVRDFTYVDDIVEGVVRAIDRPPAAGGVITSPATSQAPFRLFNIGNNSPVQLLRYIEVLEQCLGRKAQLDMKPMQTGDVRATVADVSALERATGFRPATSVETGVARFVEWYRSYYKVG
ncbi:MAG: NAD-dependent epimerase [Betaproteobacteria bacterium]|nr:NAD-dependent epimerase [Betaproteobacteria bacterium]